MTQYICRATGCHNKTATRFGIYCNAHRARLKRHGAIDQRGITKADLKPYMVMVQNRLDKNQDKPLLSQLEAHWEAVVHLAQRIDAEARSGKPMNRVKRIAAREFIALSGAHIQLEIIKTVLAFYLMQDQEPRRFRTDRAFRTQMVRRVRGLTPLNAQTWTDPQTGKIKKACRELSLGCVDLMSRWLIEVFGVAGLHLAKLERRDQETIQRDISKYYSTLDRLA